MAEPIMAEPIMAEPVTKTTLSAKKPAPKTRPGKCVDVYGTIRVPAGTSIVPGVMIGTKFHPIADAWVAERQAGFDALCQLRARFTDKANPGNGGMSIG